MKDIEFGTIEQIDWLFNDQLNVTYQQLEIIWFRNILYYMGEQWIQWIPNQRVFTKRFNSKSLLRNNKPTPVSNIIRDHVRSMKALLMNKDFAVKIWPNSEEKADRDAAVIGEDLLQSIHQADDDAYLDEKEKVAVWLCLAGTAFMRSFPEMNRGEFGIDSKGAMLPAGEITNECMIPFNVRLDEYGAKLTQKRYVGIQSLKPREWVEDTFKAKIASDTQTPQVNYQRRLMNMVGNVSPIKSTSNAGLTVGYEDDDLVLFREVEYRPTKKYPNGRYVIAAGGSVIQDNKRMPIPVTKEGKWFYTLTDFHYFYSPGRFWSDPSVNDLISPQNTINSIDQDQEINRKSIGKPWILQPKGTTYEKKSSTGSGLRVLEYDPNTAGGQKPEVVNPVGLPATVANERDTHMAVSQDASGDPKGVLRGKQPTAQASGIMVDILRDTAEQSHYPDIARFYRSLQRVDKKSLVIAQEVYTEDRILKIKGKGNNIRVRTFKAADLRGNTDVRLELASGLSSTNAGKISTIMQLVEKGLFGDITQSPEMRNQLLTKLGLADFKDRVSVDIDRAESEHSILINWGMDGDEGIFVSQPQPVPAMDETGGPLLNADGTPTYEIDPETGQPYMEEQVIFPDPLFKYDNHEIHYEVHRKFILSREFKTLDEESQGVMIMHNDIHHQLLQAEQQAAMEAQMAMDNPPEPEGPEGPPE